jgi:5S rRNA maturation endonuclease (ribonuclease M5)|tara:strand:+ start:896 stop:1078 length:183 start_codon:yes stop_codon:yes gene_type:complete
MWINRLKELLGKSIINQEDYDEFVAIGNTLTKESDIEKYQQFGEGIYLLLDPDVKTGDDF